MLDSEYAFITAYLKGEESKTVTSSHLARMARVSRTQDILSAIADTDIGIYLAEVSLKTFNEVDQNLWIYFGKCLDCIYRFNPVPDDIKTLLWAYIAKYDIINIKSALHSIRTGIKIPFIPVGNISRNGLIDEIESAKDIQDVIDVLFDCNLLNYASILRNYDSWKSKETLFEMDSFFDETYYKELISLSRTIEDGGKLAGVFGFRMDIRVLKVAIRRILSGLTTYTIGKSIIDGYMISRTTANEILSLTMINELPTKLNGLPYRCLVEEVICEYNKNNDISVVDELFEKREFMVLKDMLSSIVMSPHDIIWYIFIKEMEIRNVRIIYKSAFDDIPLDEIKHHLVTIA